MQLRGQRSGQILYIDPQGPHLGDGLFPAAGQDGARLVAKLLPEARRTAEQQERLLRMIARPPADPLLDRGAVAVAWPIELLLDEGGGLCGYLMPLGEGRPIDQISTPQVRRQALPGFHFGRLVETARRLAYLVRALHANGWLVFPEFAPGHVLVRPRDARVTLLHADAFQEGTAGDTGADRMVLAYLLFYLLLEGAHPYKGVERGPYAPPERLLANLPPALCDLFARGFRGEASDFPEAAAFCAELDRLEVSSCGNDPDHVFSRHLGRCPICHQAPAPTVSGPLPLEPVPDLRTRRRASPAVTRLVIAGGVTAVLLVAIVGLLVSHEGPSAAVDNQGKKCSKWGAGDGKPVFCVTFLDAVRFANLLSEQAGLLRCYEIDGDTVHYLEDLARRLEDVLHG